MILNPQISPQRFPYRSQDPLLGEASLLPYLPFALVNGTRSIEVEGMLDTGATVNVLPYQVGIHLGAIWENQERAIQLTGNLAKLEAKGLVLTAQIAAYNPVRLAFAWTQAQNIPIILGQINFFLAYEVCFYRAESQFEIKPRSQS